MIREGLYELALDLLCASDAFVDDLWGSVAPVLWSRTRNPWLVLHTLSDDRIETLERDEKFCQMLSRHLEARRKVLSAKSWFDESYPEGELRSVAYFSMEFGLSEALPIYSGGLGVLAGDHLKAASDLGVPVIGIGLLFQEGYFRQAFNEEGKQTEFYPHNDPVQLPIRRTVTDQGDPVRVAIELPGRRVWLRVWQVEVGRILLYLLDSNDLLNTPADRGITSQLYGGGAEIRLQQEIILGIGGMRLLRTLGKQIQICHLNEGHAAFAILERIHSLMERKSLGFQGALQATQPGNLFTTHTPVPAGFDRFDPHLITHYFHDYATELRIGIDGLLALGRENPSDHHEFFNMAYLAVRGSGAVNGVSRLHGEVSRSLFSAVAPDVPMGYITNGVHVPTWESPEAHRLWTHVCGSDCWKGTMKGFEKKLHHISDQDLWQFCKRGREALICYARIRLARQLQVSGYTQSDVEIARHIFDEETLTLGFARRFASYKRPNLLLHDSERLMKILTDANRPVQLIIAGKAHPDDEEGKALIKQWSEFIHKEETWRHVIFIDDYDMLLAERLVQGVDVWVNTPRRPSEASGTSGMKALVNGGLNLSVLDGWWAEAYSPEVGWGIEGDSDDDEAEQLYYLLENEVVPLFYTRDKQGLPIEWLSRVRESMARLTPHFSTNRMVREYTEHYYLPAARTLRKQHA